MGVLQNIKRLAGALIDSPHYDAKAKDAFLRMKKEGTSIPDNSPVLNYDRAFNEWYDKYQDWRKHIPENVQLAKEAINNRRGFKVAKEEYELSYGEANKLINKARKESQYNRSQDKRLQELIDYRNNMLDYDSNPDEYINVTKAINSLCDKYDEEAYGRYGLLSPKQIRDKENNLKEVLNNNPEYVEIQNSLKTAEDENEIEELYERQDEIVEDIKDQLGMNSEEYILSNPPDFMTFAKDNGLYENDMSNNYLRMMEKRPIQPKFYGESPSNQRFITRYHTTRPDNLPGIARKGLQARTGGGFMDNLELDHPGRIKGAFTSSRSPVFDGRGGIDEYSGETTKWQDAYAPKDSDGENTLTLEFRIPKEEYRNNERYEFNPETQSKGYDYRKDEVERGQLLNTTQTGGRTDIFKKALDPNDLVAVWTSYDGSPRRFTLEDFARNSEACMNYDEDCFDAQEKIWDLLNHRSR